MTAGEYCNRELVIVSKSEPVRAAIDLMRSRHVGDVIVVDRQGEQLLPVGILTDRDIVVEILAEDVDLDAVTIGDVMSDQIFSIPENTSLMIAVKYMHERGVRRMPVVDRNGSVVGVITVDDVLELVAELLHDLAALLQTEQAREFKQRVAR